MRHRDLDAAHLLEPMREDTVIKQLVPIFDPGNARLGIAHHDAHDSRIGGAGYFCRFDHLAILGARFGFIDITQPRHRAPPCWIRAQTRPIDCYATKVDGLRTLNILYLWHTDYVCFRVDRAIAATQGMLDAASVTSIFRPSRCSWGSHSPCV